MYKKYFCKVDGLYYPFDCSHDCLNCCTFIQKSFKFEYGFVLTFWKIVSFFYHVVNWYCNPNYRKDFYFGYLEDFVKRV